MNNQPKQFILIKSFFLFLFSVSGKIKISFLRMRFVDSAPVDWRTNCFRRLQKQKRKNTIGETRHSIMYLNFWFLFSHTKSREILYLFNGATQQRNPIFIFRSLEKHNGFAYEIYSNINVVQWRTVGGETSLRHLFILMRDKPRNVERIQ